MFASNPSHTPSQTFVPVNLMYDLPMKRVLQAAVERLVGSVGYVEGEGAGMKVRQDENNTHI